MKRVLEINPNNADAQRELARLQTLLQIKAQPVQSTHSQIKPQPVLSPSPSKKTKSPNLSSYILVTALVIICVFCFVGTSLFAARNSANTSNESVSVTTIEVYIMSKSFVKNQLKAPATAEWPAFDEIKVQKFPDPPNTYRVVGYVDSENGFGALIRTNYTCDLTYKGGDWANPQNWEVINIVFDQ